MSRVLRFGGVLAVVVVLAGCAPASAPPARPAATATLEPAPALPAAPAVRPNPVFAITCAELLSLDEVQSKVAAPLRVWVDDSSVPDDLFEVKRLQQGALNCRWGDEDGAGDRYEDGVEVRIRPSSPDEFRDGGEWLSEPWEVAGADRAQAACWFYGGVSRDSAAPGACESLVLVGTTFVYFRFNDSEGAYPSEAAIGEVARELLSTVIARLGEAGSREQLWVAPQSGAAHGDLCGDLGTAFVAALSVDSLAGGESRAQFDGATTCTYTEGDRPDTPPVGWINALHSGAWVAGVPDMAEPGYVRPWEARRTAAGALWWLRRFEGGLEQLMEARAAVDGDLVVLSVLPAEAGISPAAAEAALTAVMEQYADAPPGT